MKAKHHAIEAGYSGEQRLDEVFQRYTFTMKHKVLHDISLTSSTKFQLDSLFITPAYAFIMEVKNIAGSIKVKSNPPLLIRTLENGKISGFNSPIAQVQTNVELFQDWLHARQISLPVYSAVVLAFPKNDVDVFDTEVPFLYPSGIPNYIRTLPTTPPLLDNQTFSSLVHDLILGHSEYIPLPICSTYSIPKPDFNNGVACPSCGCLGMKKYMKGWRCIVCQSTSPDAHIQAIRDYFHLFGGIITNKKCRHFLKLESRQAATRILTGMQLHPEGEKRNRTYQMFFN